ncbi:MAG: putative ABC transport system permease protein [Mariniblastus sp.]|jgi:putative ABC transport system permease protein
MNVFKIAWRSIQHRGIGSLLTIVSMALGVMMVVAVLTIHGVVAQSFRNNNSFGYNMIVGARGGGLQLTLNSVYYLSKPVENIPYEYYLAFCDAKTRNRELQNSIAFKARELNADSLSIEPAGSLGLGGFGAAITDALTQDALEYQHTSIAKNNRLGLYKRYTHIAIPLCQGDYYVDPETQMAFRCIGTKPNFFTDLVLDIETEEKFQFSDGRCFEENNAENGFFECVVGATVAKRCNLKVGDKIQATHDNPESEGSHLHEQLYTIVGVVARTGTPNDRAVFLNMEGFYLMEDHAKPIEKDSMIKTEDEIQADAPLDVDPLGDEFFDDDGDGALTDKELASVKNKTTHEAVEEKLTQEDEYARKANNTRVPLPIEQREVTSVLVRTSLEDEVGLLAYILPSLINEGDIESTLDWSPYRPERSQKAVQAVNPVDEIAKLFAMFVDPIRWLLLALTCMICVVSALSILVGIYNSMNQRHHEIAVMRALGANRSKVMMIILCEAILLAFAGGMLGWIAGHGLNVALGPIVESRTGVPLSFLSFAPAVPVTEMTAGFIPASIGSFGISPEFLIIPSLMLLAVVVGIYPAISAYRTDVSKSLGK